MSALHERLRLHWLLRGTMLLTAIASCASWCSVGRGQALTAYNYAVLSDNPRFYWNFNEASGSATELVRRQANDQLVPMFAATRGASQTTNLGSAAVFNGSNLYHATGLADGSMNGAFAIEFWAKADGTLTGSRQDYLMHNGGNNVAVIYDFGVGGDNRLGLCCTGGRTDPSAGAPTINDTNWHHYVLTFYGNGAGVGVADRFDVAVDGVVSTIPRGGFSSNFNLNGALSIGNDSPSLLNGFLGQIDEFALYDLSNLSQSQVSARTQEIASHFAAAAAPATTDLFLVDSDQITYNYTAGVQPNPNNNRNDPLSGTLGGGKLINGVIASTNTGANLSDGSTVGFNDPSGFNGDNGQPHPGVVFNLGEAVTLEEVWIDYIGAASAAGVAAPDRVDIEFSSDGITFDDLMSFTDFNDTSSVASTFWSRRLVADVDGVQAEFVRLNFFSNQEWVFLSEVQFLASPAAPVPEPSGVAVWSLVGVGLVGFAVWRLQRR